MEIKFIPHNSQYGIKGKSMQVFLPQQQIELPSQYQGCDDGLVIKQIVMVCKMVDVEHGIHLLG